MDVLLNPSNELWTQYKELAAIVKQTMDELPEPKDREPTWEETREAVRLYKEKGKAACNNYLKQCSQPEKREKLEVSNRRLMVRALEIGFEAVRQETLGKLDKLKEQAAEQKPAEPEPKLKQVLKEDGTPDWDATMRANGVKL